MKASELRIGNLVWNHVQGVAVPVDLRILGQMIAAEKGFGEVWRPIPLTEEWLLKFGFEYDNGFYVSPCHEFHTGIKNPFVIWNGDWNEVDKHYPIRKIHYVHQLQNLYFALTGKELELK